MASDPSPPLRFCPSLLLPLLLLLVTWGQRSGVEGHGRLIDPPSRASMWREGFDSPRDYDDNQGYCGGQSQLWHRFRGRCGVCGDPWLPRPRAHERGGRYYDGTPVRVYRQGDVIRVVTAITANHRGWMEFRLCPYDDPGPDDVERDVRGGFVEVSQRCLDKHVLQMADGSGARFYLPQPFRVGQYSLDLRLPPHLSCQRCLLQWKWNVANSWGRDPNGTSCVGCGPQEQFYACADVIIQPTGWNNDDPPDYPPDYPDYYPDYYPDPTYPPPALPYPPERVTYPLPAVTYPPPMLTYPPPSATSLPRRFRPPFRVSLPSAYTPTIHHTSTVTDKPILEVTTKAPSPTTVDSNPQPKQPPSWTPPVANFWQWLIHHRLDTPPLAERPTPGNAGKHGLTVQSWWQKLRQPTLQPFWKRLNALQARKETLQGRKTATHPDHPRTDVSSVQPISTTTTSPIQEAAETAFINTTTSVRDRLSHILSLAQHLKDTAFSLLIKSKLPLSADKKTKKEKATTQTKSHRSWEPVGKEQSSRSRSVLPWLQPVQSRGPEFPSSTSQTPDPGHTPWTPLSLDEHDNPLDNHDNPTTDFDNPMANHDKPKADHNNPKTDFDNPKANFDHPVANHNNPMTYHDNPKADHNNPMADHDNPIADHDNPIADHDNPMADLSWHPSSADKDLNIVAYSAMLVPPTNQNDGRTSTRRKPTNHIAADTSHDQPLSAETFESTSNAEKWKMSAADGRARGESHDNSPTNDHALQTVQQASANENILPPLDLTDRESARNNLNSLDSGKQGERNALFPPGVGNRNSLPQMDSSQHRTGHGNHPAPPYPDPTICSPRGWGRMYQQMWTWCHVYCSRGLCLQAYCLCH